MSTAMANCRGSFMCLCTKPASKRRAHTTPHPHRCIEAGYRPAVVTMGSIALDLSMMGGFQFQFRIMDLSVP